MIRRTMLAAMLIAAPSMTFQVRAGIPVTEKMTCPIGGATFDFTTTGSYSTWGQRPDGKPYGSWEFPMALPECPDNGLVLYKQYTPEEVAKLEPLVASAAYQALRKEDTSYYRAHWLMREMGLDPIDYLFVLLQASWQADARPELRARYLAEFAEGTAKLDADPKNINWIGMEGRAVNALRELGRFDEAAARLEKIPLTALNAASADKTEQARNRAWLEYFADLKKVIARQDASSEPFDMVPRRVALTRCDAKGEDAKSEFCVKFAEEELKRVTAPKEQSGR